MEQESCEDDHQIIVEEDLKSNADSSTIEASCAEPLTSEEIRWFYKDKRQEMERILWIR